MAGMAPPFVQTGSGPNPVSLPTGTGGYFPGGKRPGREADHSSAKVKKTWIYASTPPYAFMAWCWVKHRDNVTFT
jgi:hypothetical protein